MFCRRTLGNCFAVLPNFLVLFMVYSYGIQFARKNIRNLHNFLHLKCIASVVRYNQLHVKKLKYAGFFFLPSLFLIARHDSVGTMCFVTINSI